MSSDEIRRHSRWMMRAQEWDEPRARYPNVWHDDMPCNILAFSTVAWRLRLGDLIAIFYPSSQRHSRRSERFLGLSRVAGLRKSHDPEFAWVDLETEHKFEPPLDLGRSPRRVFLCCDPGWSEQEVDLFRKVFDAAVAGGWKPRPEDAEEGAAPKGPPKPKVEEPEPVAEDAVASITEEEIADLPVEEPETGDSEDVETISVEPSDSARLFGGASFSGQMRDPRAGTWLALIELTGDRLRLVRLEATGRGGLQGHLRNPDGLLMNAEAIGLGFPFSVPIKFAESLLGGGFPEEGWWALARKVERMTRPEYLVRLGEFKESNGEQLRFTDEIAGSVSPLHRVGPDLGSRSYQGIKMIAEERSRYAIRPFESALGKLLLEVNPDGAAKRLGLDAGEERRGRASARVAALSRLERLPVEIDTPFRRQCQARPAAFDAVVAARCAAVAILSGETDKVPEELDAENSDQVRKEGWIYGLKDKGSDS
jgi:hypothetical protein